MLTLHLSTWLFRSCLGILILALGLTPTKSLATPCCECEDESFGVSLSKGPGFAALVAGGTIALSGIVVLMAAAARNQHSHHHSSSNSQNNNNDLNQDLLTTNTTNTTNTGTGVATTGLINSNQLTGLVNTNAITNTTTTQGGNPTVGNIPIIREKMKRKNDEHQQEILTFHYQLTVLAECPHSITLVPFVICPDGTRIEASPLILMGSHFSVSLDSLPIAHSENGTYLAGIYSPNSLSIYSCVLNMTLVSSKGESQTAHISSLGDQEMIHSFNHDAEL